MKKNQDQEQGRSQGDGGGSEKNKFTIEKLNSSRLVLAEKGASDSEAHEFIARSVCGA